ncbi:hypothetical protein [Micromonospora sp. HNM0581]|uniref:hypothetical protein n=1 Tax=Micromonospora sp. HNM0581 TaxID=2716341 RepID=UPI001F10F8FE|nr:hypothetical protein [Micromonospora sp. HNM0581]
MTVGALHHVELWIPDLNAAMRSWGWLLGELGWTSFQQWQVGHCWRLGGRHDRLALRPQPPGQRYEVELVASG